METWRRVFGGIQTQYKTSNKKNPKCKQVSRVQRRELDTALGRFSYVVKPLKCDESCRLGFCSDSSLELDTFVFQIADLPNLV